MKQLISVIVPVYNSEKYLKECINSILHQTYENIEIIIINDGSTDNSLLISQELQKEDKRIKIINQKNSGVSYSRNKGIQEATGEYIMFVDSDDFIVQNYIELMYKEITKNNYDACISGMTFCDKNRKIIKKEMFVKNNIELNFKEIIPSFVNTLYFCSSCKTLIKRKKIIENCIKFKEDLSFGEDLRFSFDVIRSCKRIGYLSECGYFYRQNGESITHENDIKTIKKYLRDSLEVYMYIEKFINEPILISNRLFTKLNYALRKVTTLSKINYQKFKEYYNLILEEFEKNVDFSNINLKNIDYETNINSLLLYVLKNKQIHLYYSLNVLLNKMKSILRK